MLDDCRMTLRLPEPEKPFTVATDATDHGIGAVLSQSDRVVECVSRVLTPAEQKWTTTRLRKERRVAVRNVGKKQISDTKKAEQQRWTWKSFAVVDLVKCEERKNNVAGRSGSGNLISKWEEQTIVMERRSSVYTIRREDKRKRVNAIQLQKWFQDYQECESRTAPNKTAVRRSERLREQHSKTGEECGVYYLYWHK
ncbi:unnamed protein product [Schistosoma bovis]|nr:unnamed protein product [Schistosoma bovis]CAH8672318.1 unnamed protein product [Schistosoma bovis]